MIRGLALLVAILAAAVVLLIAAAAHTADGTTTELGPFPTGDGDRVEVAP